MQEPRKGYYENVIIYEDFASLYPNIMRSDTLCYSTYVYPADLHLVQDHVVSYPADPLDHEGFDEAHRESVARAARGDLVVRAFPMDDGRVHHFVQALEGDNLGVVPELLNDVLAARKRAKRAMADAPDDLTRRVQNARQLSLKITANSMYGFTGVPQDMAMLPLSAVAETTTAMGRYLITLCAAIVPRQFSPRVKTLVYGDSVTGDTAVLIRGTDGAVRTSRIDELVPDHAPWGRGTARGCVQLTGVGSGPTTAGAP